MIRIAVDAMGGDVGPAVTFPASLAFLASHPDAVLMLVGQPESMAVHPLHARLLSHDRCQIVAASEVVTMDDSIEIALRRKKNSSMRVALNQVRDGNADVAVSGGNTGALMAIARYVFKTLDGIDRPAIASQLPNAAGRATTVLDLGANVDCTEDHLLQFALLGSALVAAIDENPSPSVGLLNIGEEAIKGGDMIKKAGKLLRAASDAGDIYRHCGVRWLRGKRRPQNQRRPCPHDWRFHQGRVFAQYIHQSSRFDFLSCLKRVQTPL